MKFTKPQLAASIILLLAIGYAIGSAYGASISYGPYHAVLDRVIDGDTVVMKLETEPDHLWDVSIRLRGVDTPEIHKRKGWNPCQIPMGLKAKAFTKNWFMGATEIKVTDLTLGSYTHRAVAKISAVKDGVRQDLGTALLSHGRARHYVEGETGKGGCQ